MALRRDAVKWGNSEDAGKLQEGRVRSSFENIYMLQVRTAPPDDKPVIDPGLKSMPPIGHVPRSEIPGYQGDVTAKTRFTLLPPGKAKGID